MKTSKEYQNVLAHAIEDRYRCPATFLDFVLNGELSRESGFFRFGPDATCYGRSSSGVAQELDSPLCDALAYAVAENRQVRLPFDPSDVIDNLRLERYLDSHWSVQERVFKR